MINDAAKIDLFEALYAIVDIFKETFAHYQIVGNILEHTYENPDPEYIIERFDDISIVVEIVEPST